ncbi:hypothetical protein IWX90DRAFT_294734 [Phyllosticta citrichinensis]|uniref:Uncharacterized protein n=1 Tax=Phyllosticta citrichinensis TaxID=1130410 RepID=A0ABR1XK77_9PEZI
MQVVKKKEKERGGEEKEEKNTPRRSSGCGTIMSLDLSSSEQPPDLTIDRNKRRENHPINAYNPLSKPSTTLTRPPPPNPVGQRELHHRHQYRMPHRPPVIVAVACPLCFSGWALLRWSLTSPAWAEEEPSSLLAAVLRSSQAASICLACSWESGVVEPFAPRHPRRFGARFLPRPAHPPGHSPPRSDSLRLPHRPLPRLRLDWILRNFDHRDSSRCDASHSTGCYPKGAPSSSSASWLFWKLSGLCDLAT